MLEDLNLYTHEVYESVQGETSFAGIPTVFVRLSACNLRCTWCDTPYAFGKGTPFSLVHLLEKIDSYQLNHVCITGGEPLLQKNVFALIKELCNKNYTVSIETGGSLPIKEIDPRAVVILDVKCPGSGMEKRNDWSNIDALKPKDEVKFVIADRADYDYAVAVCQKYELFEKTDSLLFSPVHNVLNPQDLIKWILQDKLPVRLNLQIHKYIWTPETLGV